ncbi:hypothetical protein ABZT06_38530 [Streptomyces sp. NPDC005483]|uniref:hypothetical protein n=1 Tax=Streptomyces sp. NPDC005483 TaxID=3154882 RepID=UPI0033B892AD
MAPTVASPSPTTASPAPSRPVDELDGISLPLPDGWAPSKYVTRDNVVMTTEGGRVFTHTLPGNSGASGNSPAGLARKDIPRAAGAPTETSVATGSSDPSASPSADASDTWCAGG